MMQNESKSWIGISLSSESATRSKSLASKKRTSGVLGFLFVTLSCLSACTWTASNKLKTPVVVVNTEAFTLGEFSKRLLDRLKKLDSLQVTDPAHIRELKKQELDQVIIELLLIDWAKKNNIKIEEPALSAELESFTKDFPDSLSFLEELKKTYTDINEFKDQLRRSLLLEKAKAEIFKNLDSSETNSPSAKEVELEMSQLAEKVLAEEFLVRQIYVQDLAHAEELKKTVNLGNFKEMAKKFSEAPESNQEGLVGWIRKGDFQPFDEALNQPLNKIIGPIASNFGYHILLVERKRKPAKPTLENSQKEISALRRQRLEQGLYMNWLDQQLKSAKISIREGLINNIKIEIGSMPQ